MKPVKQAEGFFKNLIDLFQKNNLSFMIGGTYAFRVYTGIERPTNDVDFFTTEDEYPKLLHVCTQHGYQTKLLDKQWIAKIRKDQITADVIFAERNGIRKVSTVWLDRATTGRVLGRLVKLMSVEDMIHSKAYIQSRNRYDGADVIHLILCCGKAMDWEYLYATMQQDWELLLSYFLLFRFVYPSDRESIPSQLFADLLKKAQKTYGNHSPKNRVTRGLLLSTQYTVDIEKWGYKELVRGYE